MVSDLDDIINKAKKECPKGCGNTLESRKLNKIEIAEIQGSVPEFETGFWVTCTECDYEGAMGIVIEESDEEDDN